MSRILKVAIDGLAGSGRRTTAQLLALRLNFCYIDHDAMARAVVLKCHDFGVKIGEDEDGETTKRIVELAKKSNIHLPSLGEFELDGRNITEALKHNIILKDVRKVLNTPGVREALAEQQRALANIKNTGVAYEGFVLNGKQYRGSVTAGHDICSVVLPDADVKVFLKAGFATRVKRLFEKHARDIHRPCHKTEEDLRKDLMAYDEAESTKHTAKDMVTIDTTNLSSDEQVRRVQELVFKKIQ